MSARKLLLSTELKQLQPLSYQGSGVHSQYHQLARIIALRLSKEHAALLAEPILDPNRDTVDWFSRTVGSVEPFADLPPERQEEIKVRLEALRDDLQGLAKTLSASGERHQRHIGELLLLTMQHPGEDYLYVVDGNPVLVGWGFIADPGQDKGEPRRLTRTPSALEEQPASAPIIGSAVAQEDASSAHLVRTSSFREVNRGASVQATADGAAAHEGSPRRFLGMNLMWLVSFFILGMLLSLLVQWALARWHRQVESSWSATTDRETLIQLGRREMALRGEMERLQSELREKRRYCVNEDHGEFDRRLNEAGGTFGDLNVYLLWNNKNDLDLFVVEPGGKIAGRPIDGLTNNSQGRLDVDANVVRLRSDPVEHVLWNAPKAKRGKYQVYVHYFKVHADEAPTRYQVKVMARDGRSSVISGQISFDEREPRNKVIEKLLARSVSVNPNGQNLVLVTEFIY